MWPAASRARGSSQPGASWQVHSPTFCDSPKILAELYFRIDFSCSVLDHPLQTHFVPDCLATLSGIFCPTQGFLDKFGIINSPIWFRTLSQLQPGRGVGLCPIWSYAAALGWLLAQGWWYSLSFLGSTRFFPRLSQDFTVQPSMMDVLQGSC